MKIYISVDMEGISAIACREQTNKSHPNYQQGQALMMGDVNAAIKGAFDGGASEVIVADMHASTFNLLPQELDSRAQLICGFTSGPRFPYLDKDINGMFLIGYHAMAGTLNATLEHTMSSKQWHKVTINNRPVGETAIDASLAGLCSVPVVMVSGDDKLCIEARDFLGDIETAQVKIGLGRHKAMCLSPQKGQELIYQCAYKAVKRLANGEKFSLLKFKSPIDFCITYKHTEDADDAAENIPTIKRIDGYKVAFIYNNIGERFGGIWKKD